MTSKDIDNQPSSSDESIDFENELSDAFDYSDLDSEQLLDKIKPRQHLEEPKRFSAVFSKLKESSETSTFKVIGQAEVALTCKPTTVIAPWIQGSTNFSGLVKSKSNLSALSTVPGISLKLIEAFFQFTDVLFPVQQAVIPAILASSRSVLPPRDFVISAPTGSGKTLCFVLPILNELRIVENDASAVYALIVAPVQNLARQIYVEFLKYNVFGAKIVLLSGVKDYLSERASLFPIDNLDNVSNAHIIVATPGRLVEHLVDTRGIINLTQLRFLVIDEADRMLDTARIEWLGLVERRSNASSTNNLTIADLTNSKYNRYLQKILCSATLSLDLEQFYLWNLRYPKLFKADSNQSTEIPVDFSVSESKAKSTNEEVPVIDLHPFLPANLKQQVIMCLPNMKPIFLYFLISSYKNWKKVLVFVNQKSISRRLTLLLTLLAKSKFTVEEFSSNLYGTRRDKCLKQFEEGKIRVLIASDVLSRGIDVSNIDCVVNYNPPINERIFVHRAGRTARGLSSGTVLSLVDKNERMRLKKMLLQLKAWSDDFVLDRRDTEKYLNEDLMDKYKKALSNLKTCFTKN